jgi:hypothetical protein
LPNIRDAILGFQPTEGEAIIFRVDGPGASTTVARVMPTDWPRLADAVAPE